MGAGSTIIHWKRTTMLVVLGLIALVVPACTDEDAGDEQGNGGRTDEEVIALTVLQVGDAEITLAPDMLREHLTMLFQVNGQLGRADAECATDVFLDGFEGDEPLSRLPLSEVLSADTQRDRREAVDACVPPTPGPEVPSDPFETTMPEPPPEDLDGAGLRAHLVDLTAVVARSLGMDQDEADCFGAEAYGGLDDRQIVAILNPAALPDIDLPERTGIEEVQACLSTERIEELGEELLPRLEAHEQAAADQPTEPPSVVPGG